MSQCAPNRVSAMPIEKSNSDFEPLLAFRNVGYLLALRLTGHASDAEDAVQEAYLKVARLKCSIPPGAAGRLWFLRIVANTAKNLRSMEHSRRERERNATVNAQAKDQTVDNCLRDAVAITLASLPENVRAPICLHYEQGLSYAEAAEVLEENEGTLRVNASRGIALLREKLARRGFSVAPVVLIGTLQAGLCIQSSTALVAAVETILAGSAAPVSTIAPGLAVPGAVAKGAVVSATLKAGLLAGSLLAVAAAVLTVRYLDDPYDFPKEDESRPAAVEPTAAPVPSKKLAETLAQKIDVIYHNDWLSEVLADLDQRVGLRSAFPKPIDGSFNLTLEEKQVTVRQVLEILAEAGKLELEYHDDTVVFWKRSDDMVLAGLVKKLKEGNVEARCEAVYDLAQLGDKRSYGPLVEALRHDPDPAVCGLVILELEREHATCLGAWQDAASIVAPILKLLDGLTGKNYRLECITLLGTSRDPRAVESLFALLNDSNTSANERSHAQRALGNMRDLLAVEPLILLLNDSNKYVRCAAASALGNSRDPRAVKPLIALLKDSNESVRSHAASVLGNTRDSRAVEPLIALLKDSVAFVRCFAADALGNTRDPRAIEQLIAILKDKDSYTNEKYVAARALGATRDPHAVEALFVLLKHSDRYVRSEAADVLRQTRYPHAVESLFALLKDSDGYVRSAAAGALGNSRDPRAVEPLIALLKDSDVNMRTSVVYALGQTRDPRAVESLIALLKDSDVNMRISAVFALGQTRDPRTVGLLIALLKDSDVRVRHTVANALRNTQDPHVVMQLIALLKDADESVRNYAAIALDFTRDPHATAALTEYKMSKPQPKKSAQSVKPPVLPGDGEF